MIMIHQFSALNQQDLTRFDIAFYGDVRDGFDEHHAKRSLKALFDLPDYTIEAMFMVCRTVIKSNVDILTAKKYRQKLYTYGIDTAIELTAPSKVNAMAKSLDNAKSNADAPVNNVPTEAGQPLVFPFVITSPGLSLVSSNDEIPEPSAEPLLPQAKISAEPLLSQAKIESVKEAVDTTDETMLPSEGPLLLGDEQAIEPQIPPVAPDIEQLPSEYHFGGAQRPDLLLGLDEFADAEPEDPGLYTVPARKVGAPQYVLFNLTGQLGEYMKLWWLSTVMTLLSCGLHRPYVDANRKRFFYRHLSTPKGEQFEYKGPSTKLMNGYWPFTAWMLGFLCLAVVSLKLAVLVGGLSMMFILPYCFITIRQHHLAVTRFRGAPFKFSTDYLSALKYFLGWPILAALSMGLLLPRALKTIHQFIVENTDYAGIPFTFKANPEHYIMASLGIAACGVCGVFALTLNTWYLNLAALAGAGLVLWIWSMTLLINIYYNSSEWQGFRFYANYGLASYTCLVIGNVVGVVLTAGLLIPWAMMRSAKYKALHISLIE